ncbi:DNA-binding transcriptional regulator, FrmR family [Ferrithrix thermotolerans DSM 19514]|jgi:DNA-binding FrmR family transcriptional regulator|uniref:DNA-binding transcriptional regulator, FrmR family n=1 Tax=Ferrithrix thermotolerans DSM 19514 TaxID=1121881 RepID=A0A1M4XBA2_9ACTN|nr:metal-sensitive transcriptional regulator [Ferrithrix thermotolerans]SHE90462.1 DNA-binding transcriptional regulator, FrmR family [Ferrithrix thermotolerans DSM 19514]
MELPQEVIDEVTKRLRRVEGQVGGLIRMVQDGRDCKDILTQLSAASKALEQAGFRLVASGMTYCLEQPEKASADGYSLEEVQKLFMKLA